MKIVWLDLNSSYAHSSLALPALHAQIMDRSDIEWHCVSATINEQAGGITASVYTHRPDVVAATCWLFNHEMLMHVLARVKSLLPSVTIILGGPEFLGDNHDFLVRNPFVDCVFRGEGEEQFPQWLSVCSNPGEWGRITGVCYLDEKNQYRDNGLARVLHFDRLVNPESSPFFNWEKPFVQLETTRGCFNTCTFCVSGGEKPVRSLSIEEIHRRIQLIHSQGIRNIRVLDRTFNYNLRHARELFAIFRNYPDICFHLEMHPALLSDEMKEELRSMPKGLLHLEAGIQSLRAEVLDACSRKGGLEASLEGLRFLCTLENMETHADLIAGLPLYHLSQILEDVRTLASLSAGEIQLESLKLLPGTEMRRRASEWGIKYSPLPPYEVLETSSITVDELQRARQLSRLLDAYYNTKTWQSVARTLIVEQESFLDTFLDYLISRSVIDQPLALERRGILLYEFCKEYYPPYAMMVSRAWIEGGCSLKKTPAEFVRTKHIKAPEDWDVVYGTYSEDMRLCQLPSPSEGVIYWYAYTSVAQDPKPVFHAVSPLEG